MLCITSCDAAVKDNAETQSEGLSLFWVLTFRALNPYMM